jgi:hypothetical protein
MCDQLSKMQDEIRDSQLQARADEEGMNVVRSTVEQLKQSFLQLADRAEESRVQAVTAAPQLQTQMRAIDELGTRMNAVEKECRRRNPYMDSPFMDGRSSQASAAIRPLVVEEVVRKTQEIATRAEEMFLKVQDMDKRIETLTSCIWGETLNGDVSDRRQSPRTRALTQTLVGQLQNLHAIGSRRNDDNVKQQLGYISEKLQQLLQNLQDDEQDDSFIHVSESYQ